HVPQLWQRQLWPRRKRRSVSCQPMSLRTSGPSPTPFLSVSLTTTTTISITTMTITTIATTIITTTTITITTIVEFKPCMPQTVRLRWQCCERQFMNYQDCENAWRRRWLSAFDSAESRTPL
ncbi:unnamed protein product, partial [Polarella glacialis]